MKKNQFDEEYNDVVLLSKILSHPARILILKLLSQEDECVGDIVKHLPLSQSTISQHLKELKDAKILLSETKANKNYYCIDKKELNKVYQQFISSMDKIIL
ncbi:winged helix-turn-helix transcriptional regulator [Francisella sp. Scap27]|uniref:ArsR/SmtB family transcription factor n=1 Tax=Francisella sp. Scap27 TaxID=2589986 RepID=UPI0015BA9EF1|nr:metalloregulator ArsR/SmtB family transcription factor [Francisella sp. Scap27]QLE79073.1 winged helix-turn-helix transcriptional regulator [Francisella sp. Scap27]